MFRFFTGIDVGLGENVGFFREALLERNEELLAMRDELFQGSNISTHFRSFVEQSRARLDEIGRSSESAFKAIEHSAADTVEAIASSSKINLADANTFGSAGALSAINKASLSGAGQDEGVKVQKESLTVEKQALDQLRRLNLNLPKLAFQSLELA